MIKKKLNLIDRDNSEIPYKIDKYPDGQTQLVIDLPDNKCHLDILMDINSGQSLFNIMQLSDIINRRQLTCSITIAYLMAARTDRLFSWNTAHTLKIVADVINSFHADQVRILTPHSDMSLRLINNSIAIEPFNYMLYEGNYPFLSNIILSPDEGARDRLTRLISQGYQFMTSKLPYCKKVRGINGQVESIEVIDMTDLNGQYNVMVLDDLCDGGGTFIKLRPELDKFNPKEVNIMVTHAIQQKGIIELANRYNNVYITNSYSDWDSITLPKNVHVFDIIEKLTE